MKNLKKIFYSVSYIALMLTIFCAELYIAEYLYDMYKAKKQSNLLNETIIDRNEVIIENTTDDNLINPVKTERMLKLEELQKGNSDIVAWIEIENTNINYPVLQGNDNSFYMNHNYEKRSSSSGAIFLDKDYSFELPSTNLLIYGHNMKNGTMFRDLLKYEKKSFFDEHPTIRFTTNKEDAVYDIIAVFKSKVYYKSEKDVFRYYYFINATNEQEYNEYVENAKKASLYDTSKTANYGDSLLTLSTCAYHTKDGRFVVVARKAE